MAFRRQRLAQSRRLRSHGCDKAALVAANYMQCVPPGIAARGACPFLSAFCLQPNPGEGEAPKRTQPRRSPRRGQCRHASCMSESANAAQAASKKLQDSDRAQAEGSGAAEATACVSESRAALSAEEQEANRVQRERFLGVLAGLQGKHCTWDLYGGIEVEAGFLGTDSSQSAFLVKDLASGVGIVRSAMLRGNEVISFKAEAPKA